MTGRQEPVNSLLRPKRRILHITRNLPPLVGGMERLNWHIAKELCEEYEVHIVAPERAASMAPEGAVVDEVASKPAWRFLLAGALQALRVCRRWSPDIVLAGSGLTAPLAWLVSRASGARSVVYLHGLDIAAPHLVYRWFWLPAIRRMDLVLVNSQATGELAVERGVQATRMVKLYPGVSLPVSSGESSAVAGKEFRRVHGLGDGPILLSVGRLTERKGLREFVRDVLPGVAAACPGVQLVVVGAMASEALAARSQTPDSIRAMAHAGGLEEKVHFLGVITDQMQLSCAYQAASVHVFPVREIPGDPEGFGMVAIEAAAHGLSTAAYATGGVVDAVEHGVSGYLATPGDAEAMTQQILRLLEDPLPQSSVKSFAGKFAWSSFGAQIRFALKNTPLLIESA